MVCFVPILGVYNQLVGRKTAPARRRFWILGCTSEVVAPGGNVVGDVLRQINIVFRCRGVSGDSMVPRLGQYLLACMKVGHSASGRGTNRSSSFPASSSRLPRCSRGSDQNDHHGSQVGSQLSAQGKAKASDEEVTPVDF